MKPYIKSDVVGEHGELGTATRIPPKSEGGERVELLASGTVTVAEQLSSLTIPGIFTRGTPKVLLVKKGTIEQGVNQTTAWLALMDTYEEISDAFGTENSLCKGYNSSGSTGISRKVFTVGENSITLPQYTTSYPIRPDSYSWYVWGVR